MDKQQQICQSTGKQLNSDMFVCVCHLEQAKIIDDYIGYHSSVLGPNKQFCLKNDQIVQISERRFKLQSNPRTTALVIDDLNNDPIYIGSSRTIPYSTCNSDNPIHKFRDKTIYNRTITTRNFTIPNEILYMLANQENPLVKEIPNGMATELDR